MPGKTLAAALLMILLLAAGTAVVNAKTRPGPKQVVENAVEEVLGILRTKGLDENSRREQIRAVIRRNFDFLSMSRSVLATNWEKASPGEQAEFVDFFSDYLEYTYLEAIENYTNEAVEYGEEKIRGDKARVDTSIVTAKQKRIPVDYKLRRTEDGWFAYDVVIEGVSLVGSYRETFAAIAASQGVRGVLSDLQGRLSKYETP